MAITTLDRIKEQNPGNEFFKLTKTLHKTNTGCLAKRVLKKLLKLEVALVYRIEAIVEESYNAYLDREAFQETYSNNQFVVQSYKCTILTRLDDWSGDRMPPRWEEFRFVSTTKRTVPIYFSWMDTDCEIASKSQAALPVKDWSVTIRVLPSLQSEFITLWTQLDDIRKNTLNAHWNHIRNVQDLYWKPLQQLMSIDYDYVLRAFGYQCQAYSRENEGVGHAYVKSDDVIHVKPSNQYRWKQYRRQDLFERDVKTIVDDYNRLTSGDFYSIPTRKPFGL